jgi:hypothetical protein
MVQAIIKISDRTNRILNIVKAKYGLKDKSAAIELMASQYEEEILEPELRPEFTEEMKEIMEQEPIDIGTVNDLKARYGR